MTTQADFGSASDREFVPSGLRGYRLFKVIGGELHSLLRQHLWTSSESSDYPVETATCSLMVITDVKAWDFCNCAERYLLGRTYFSPVSTWLTPPLTPYSHFCGVSEGVGDAKVYVKKAHLSSAPDRNCVCGFYASYNPRTLINSPGCSLYYDTPYVLGVVEASGRVVMGSKGFRSEKMRIIDTAPVTKMGLAEGLFYYPPRFDDAFLSYYPPEDLSGLLPERNRTPTVNVDSVHSNHSHWTNTGPLDPASLRLYYGINP